MNDFSKAKFRSLFSLSILSLRNCPRVQTQNVQVNSSILHFPTEVILTKILENLFLALQHADF